MKKLTVFIFSIILLGSCSSEKVLSERITHDWNINYLENDDANNSFTTIEDYQYVDENSNNILNDESESEILIASTKKVFTNNKKHFVSLSKKVEELIEIDGDCENIIFKNGSKDIFAQEEGLNINNKTKIESLSVVSMITGILGAVVWPLSIIFGPVSILLASIGLRRIKKSPEKFKGKGFAITGLILGILELLFGLFIFWLYYLV